MVDLKLAENWFERLSAQSPFDGVDRDLLFDLLGGSDRRDFADGDCIIARGDRLPALHLLVGGRVSLIGDDQRVLAELVAGEAFPLEVFDEDGASLVAGCDYRALGKVTLIAIGSDRLAALRRRNPQFAAACRDFRSARHVAGDEEMRINPLELPLGRLVRPESSVLVEPWVPVREVARRMVERGAMAAVVVGDAGVTGIFTSNDLMKRVVVDGTDTGTAIGQVMSDNPLSLPSEATGFEAALTMSRHGFHHIVVVDAEGPVGVLSDRDLYRSATGAAEIRERIIRASAVDELPPLADEIARLAGTLTDAGVDAAKLTGLVSGLNDRLTARLLEIERQRAGIAADDFCWIALGSEGRNEQTLCTDQDNAIIFAPASAGATAATRTALLVFAQSVNQALDRCGFELCKGNVMAGNPRCCLSLDEWKERFAEWIGVPEPEALLNASIYFDFRALHGCSGLADELDSWLAGRVRHNPRFLALMTANALQRTPPIGFLRGFSSDRSDGSIDLKLRGTAIFIDAARILALAVGSPARSTVSRFEAAAKCSAIHRSDAENWIAAFKVLQAARLRHHHRQRCRGEALHNRVDPQAMNNLERRILLEALRQASILQKFCAIRHGHEGAQ